VEPFPGAEVPTCPSSRGPAVRGHMHGDWPGHPPLSTARGWPDRRASAGGHRAAIVVSATTARPDAFELWSAADRSDQPQETRVPWGRSGSSGWGAVFARSAASVATPSFQRATVTMSSSANGRGGTRVGGSALRAARRSRCRRGGRADSVVAALHARGTGGAESHDGRCDVPAPGPAPAADGHGAPGFRDVPFGLSMPRRSECRTVVTTRAGAPRVGRVAAGGVGGVRDRRFDPLEPPSPWGPVPFGPSAERRSSAHRRR
jgi:hypothetical protein